MGFIQHFIPALWTRRLCFRISNRNSEFLSALALDQHSDVPIITGQEFLLPQFDGVPDHAAREVSDVMGFVAGRRYGHEPAQPKNNP